ncbi:protein of unknown function [Desulfonatronum thiosulfatophilum]|uniref:DUF4168 domain-containing protein n=1 Tax=Desulfonatronum thiosulfatophilum TaxID=617002 RepID=A0A1G6BP17_9BACT|nr:DUF4168 domain-containing protein [Desulfonatronum thiosulfatophilum]SDB22339.1 protein of unknown function [Desulfonatronum thiosulfatophilum]
MKKAFLLLTGPIFASFLVLALSLGVHAQTGHAEGQPPMQQPGTATQISDAELEKVATAYLDIHEIRMELQESLAGETDPNSAQRMQEEAGAAMVLAVQNSGLNLETYNHVMQEVQVNTELREMLTAKLDKLQ